MIADIYNKFELMCVYLHLLKKSAVWVGLIIFK